MTSPIEKNGTGVTDAEALVAARRFLDFYSAHPLTRTDEQKFVRGCLERITQPGASVAMWVDARELQPPPGQLVLVAYLWPGDPEYTVDVAELDGADWRYSGGDLMTAEQVHWWCHPPAAPAVAGLAIETNQRRDAVLAA